MSSTTPAAASTSKRPGEITTPEATTFVLLGATIGHDVSLAQIKIQGDNDENFFRKLREEYTTRRDIFRQVFSIWRYTHCDFVKVHHFSLFNFSISLELTKRQFEKIGDNLFVHRGLGIPKASDKNYHYRPKPVEHEPPVSSHEFYHHFYACYGRCASSRIAFLRSFHKCRRPCRYSQEAIDRIPKKISKLEESGDVREFFWGIFAVERISFLMVTVYHILILIPPLVFWCLWLFSWGHSGDLQNASVPFFTALSLLSLFWFPLLST
jgi:hypothetical protein